MIAVETTTQYTAMVEEIHQAADDGLVSAETAWALIDDLDQDAWYEAVAELQAADRAWRCGGAR